MPCKLAKFFRVEKIRPGKSRVCGADFVGQDLRPPSRSTVVDDLSKLFESTYGGGEAVHDGVGLANSTPSPD